MGKKTNWTVSEDQALCRSWLCAGDSSFVHTNDQKAGTFWGVVHQLFHAELETSVDRPVTGLKIRWTRINRDVQKFALVYSRVLAARTAGDTANLDVDRERQCVNEASEVFLKEQGAKFGFESCWRLLRYSPRWLQLLASAGGSSLTLESQTPIVLMDQSTAINAAPESGAIGTKRRFASLIESHARSPLEASGGAAPIVEELKRQNMLLEEQNAIALFRMKLELVEDDVARQYFRDLKQSYIKRIRRGEVIRKVCDEDEDEEEAATAARDGKQATNV